MPDINYPRSIYSMPKKTHKTSMVTWLYWTPSLFSVFNLVIPLVWNFLILLECHSISSFPMDGITIFVRAVFVPMRLLWNHWEEFIGANKGAGYQQNTYLMPANQGVNLIR